MLPGPVLIKKCSHCGSLIRQGTLMSMNNIGMTTWTDGKTKAPMWMNTPDIVKCPFCLSLIYLNKLKEVSRIERFPPDSNNKDSAIYLKNSRSFSQLGLQDYFTFLERNLTADKEKCLRIKAWWRGNDTRRSQSLIKNNLSIREKENLNHLFKLLNILDDDEHLMMIEIKRELMLYDEAKILLEKPFKDKSSFSEMIAMIEDSIHQQYSFVKVAIGKHTKRNKQRNIDARIEARIPPSFTSYNKLLEAIQRFGWDNIETDEAKQFMTNALFKRRETLKNKIKLRLQKHKGLKNVI